jgi:hypothetical protein
MMPSNGFYWRVEVSAEAGQCDILLKTHKNHMGEIKVPKPMCMWYKNYFMKHVITYMFYHGRRCKRIG